MKKSVKPYFTKYFAQPGDFKDLKIGEKIFAFGGDDDNTTGPGKLMTWTGDEHGVCRAKLFLCSRDIQVGDNVWDEHNGYYTADQMLIGVLPTNTLVHTPIKVIGEVSPEATWVEEGDEFDEDEIERLVVFHHQNKALFRDGFDPPEIETSTVQFQGNEKIEFPYSRNHRLVDGCIFPLPIRLKGPCGHFH